MLQQFIRFTEFIEFNEFLIHLGKTPLVRVGIPKVNARESQYSSETYLRLLHVNEKLRVTFR